MARKGKSTASRRPATSAPDARTATTLRIIGGRHRGRKLVYSGDPQTRPMKERVREAIFNLLGPAVKDTHAIDLFAGTGALGLEAISRGSARATLIERHFPTAAVIRQNIETLAAADLCQVVAADTFLWLRKNSPPTDKPWVVFCSPPYSFYADRPEDIDTLLQILIRQAPAGSQIVVEADDRLDPENLPRAEQWDVRRYHPAVVAILRISDEDV